MITTVQPFLNRCDLLGEGILCLPDNEGLAWVDILGKKLMMSDMAGDNLRVFDQPDEIGAVVPAIADKLVLVRRNTVVGFDPQTGRTHELWTAADIEPATNRFNDAAVDPFGNLWVCSMDFDAQLPTGALYRLTPSGTATVMATGFRCLNGPAFSPDGHTIYVGDTMGGQILAFDHDPDLETLQNRRVHIDFGPFDGLPDGMTVDAQANLWVCQVTSGRIGCFDPQGHKLKSIAVPVPIVTSCCFGGADLTTLYVTTARIILDDVDLAAYPNSGSIYRFEDAGIGLVPNKFGKIFERQLT